METVRKILADIFQMKESDITPEVNMKDIDAWDSLTHMEMIAELENELNLEFTTEEIMEMTSVAKIESIIGVKTNGNN